MPDPLYSGRYTQAFAITPSDVETVQGPLRADNTPTPYCSAIHTLTAGNVTARFMNDYNNAAVTFPVLAGVIYPYALAYVYSATTATLLGLL